MRSDVKPRLQKFYFWSELDIRVSDSVTSIGDTAFGWSGLTSVMIPAGVISIGENPYQMCPLVFIDVAQSNSVYSQIDGVLFDTRNKMLVTYPGAREGAYVIPEGTLHIGDSAFKTCYGLTSVTIPDGVTSIGGLAFSGCSGLTDVIIPDGVTSMGKFVFTDCPGLTSVTIPASVVDIGDWAFDPFGQITLTVTEGTYAEQYAKDNELPYIFITDEP